MVYCFWVCSALMWLYGSTVVEPCSGVRSKLPWWAPLGSHESIEVGKPQRVRNSDEANSDPRNWRENLQIEEIFSKHLGSPGGLSGYYVFQLEGCHSFAAHNLKSFMNYYVAQNYEYFSIISCMSTVATIRRCLHSTRFGMESGPKMRYRLISAVWSRMLQLLVPR